MPMGVLPISDTDSCWIETVGTTVGALVVVAASQPARGLTDEMVTRAALMPRALAMPAAIADCFSRLSEENRGFGWAL